MASDREFFAKLRHDLKNHLTSIKANLFFLKRNLPQEKSETVKKIEDKLEKILKTVESIP